MRPRGRPPPSRAAGRITRDHDVQPLEVLVGDAALRADFVHEAVDESHHVVGHIGALGVLEATLCVIALSHAAGDAAGQKQRRFSLEHVSPLPQPQQESPAHARQSPKESSSLFI